MSRAVPKTSESGPVTETSNVGCVVVLSKEEGILVLWKNIINVLKRLYRKRLRE